MHSGLNNKYTVEKPSKENDQVRYQKEANKLSKILYHSSIPVHHLMPLNQANTYPTHTKMAISSCLPLTNRRQHNTHLWFCVGVT